MAGENDIQNAILELLWYNKIYSWRNNNTPIYDTKRKAYRRMPKWSLKGVADILGILPDGKLLAIEVKRPKAYPSKDQKLFNKNIEVNGGVAFVARSIEDVRNHLRDYIK